MMLAIRLLLLALFAVFAVAVAPQKAVIISYPNDTPNSVLDEAKDAIRKAGGVVTHEYHLIKAFAANAPAKILETVQASGAGDHVLIEDDQIVTANGS